MSETEDLQRLRAYGIALRDCVNGLDLQAESTEIAAKVAQAAANLVAAADEPLRIGVVGEFSSGKSLLLGVLLGRPDLLPTSSQPTTGNVTELRLAPQPDQGREAPRSAGAAPRTTLDEAELSFFTKQEISELDRRMLDELGAAAQRAGVGNPLSLSEADDRGPEALASWCERVWWTADPAIRKLIRELLWTRAAVEQHAQLLGATRRLEVDQVWKLLQIPYPESADDFADVRTLGQARADGGSWPSSPPIFPLIERVILHLRVPAEIWDLTGMRDHGEFVLLDFPGVGGGLTQVRDLFLTHRGLRDAHTVLVMVDAAKPGGQVVDSFYGFLRQLTTDRSREGAIAAADAPTELEPLANRLLYCATRFDLLRPPTATEVKASVATSELTEQALVGLSDPLKALLQSGHRPGSAAMTAMLSSVTAIAIGGLTLVPAELDLKAHAETAVSRARRWRELSEELSAAGTGRDLAVALRQYADDGGLARLRWLLERHVAEHGLAQRVSRLREQAVAVDRAKAALMEHLTFHSAAAGPAIDEEAVRARRLLNEVTRYLGQFQKRVLPQIKDPSLVWLAPGRSLQDDVAAQAAELVVEWPQWTGILACVRDSVVVPPKQAQDRNGRFDLGLIPSVRSERTLPQTADDFAEIYSVTCAKLAVYARERVLDGLRRWLVSRGREVADLRQRATAMLTPEVRSRLDGGSLAGLAAGIDVLLAPESVYEGLVGLIERERPVNGDPASSPVSPGGPSGFPLRAGQAMPWSADWSGDESTRHVVRMLRIRSAFVASVTEQALAELEALQDLIYTALSFNLGLIKLPEADEQADFIAALTGRERRPGQQTQPDYVAELDAITPPAANDYL
jgi:hypothetical protein